jgi:hypothetical protein
LEARRSVANTEKLERTTEEHNSVYENEVLKNEITKESVTDATDSKL